MVCLGLEPGQQDGADESTRINCVEITPYFGTRMNLSTATVFSVKRDCALGLRGGLVSPLKS